MTFGGAKLQPPKALINPRYAAKSDSDFWILSRASLVPVSSRVRFCRRFRARNWHVQVSEMMIYE